MKNALVPLMVSCAIVGFATGLAVLVTEAENREKRRRLEDKQNEDIEDITIKVLIADPDFYTGKTVRFKSVGLERRGKSELIYRTHTDKAPSLIVQCGMTFPIPLPEYIIGLCMGVKDGAVIVLCK